ncbi:MAG: DUF1631 family protein [Ottowia sp.]|nr:DUF1631 family protein [Ottowia sp.]
MASTFRPQQQHNRLTHQARSRFVQLLDDVPQELATVIRQQYATLMEGRFSDMRSAQQMSDAQLAFDRSGRRWSEHAQRLWRDALQGRHAELATPSDLGELELIDDEVVERKIVMLRLASAVTEAAGAELRDARLRVLSLERSDDLPKRDVLRPETMANLLLKSWTDEGLTRAMWLPVSAVVGKALAERMTAAYRSLNEFLVAHGAMEKIDMRQQVRRTEGSPTQPGRLSQPGQFGSNSHPGDDLSSAYSRTAYMPPPGAHPQRPMTGYGYGAPTEYPQQFQSYEDAAARALNAMRAMRSAIGTAPPPPPPPPPPQPEPPVLDDEWDPDDSMLQYAEDYDSGRVPMVSRSALMRAEMETRMMTRAAPAAAAAAAAISPLGRMRQRAQGMLAQLQRLVAHRVKGFGEAPPDGVVPAPSPALAAALADPQYFPPTMLAPRGGAPVAYGDGPEGAYSGMETIIIPSMHALAGDLRRKADDIKAKAERPDEKATIEIVALMFQAILAEVLPAYRVVIRVETTDDARHGFG